MKCHMVNIKGGMSESNNDEWAKTREVAESNNDEEAAMEVEPPAKKANTEEDAESNNAEEAKIEEAGESNNVEEAKTEETAESNNAAEMNSSVPAGVTTYTCRLCLQPCGLVVSKKKALTQRSEKKIVALQFFGACSAG